MSQARELEKLRKISSISVLSVKYEEKRKSSAPSTDSKKPKDTFYLLHITSFLLGFMNLMPWMFFAVAFNYWMFKFRDTTMKSDASGADRVPLQSYFQSLSLIAQTIPSLLFSVFSLFTKLSAVTRTTWSLFSLVVVFGLFSVFCEINTDSWQKEFFLLTMALLFLNSTFTTTLAMSSIVLMAKLPQDYLHFFMVGQNGTFGTTVFYIIALSVTESRTTAGLIYFLGGTILIVLTLIIFLLTQTTEVFQYYNVEDNENLEKRRTITLTEMKLLNKKIWPSLVLLSLFIFNVSVLYPALQTLVVSEYERDGTLWSEKYFTSVTVFLLFDTFAAIGKFFSRKLIITANNKWWYVCIASLISLIFVPFYMLCNAQPRTLPVIFDRDWEFICMNMFFAFFGGCLINIAFMSLKLLSNNQEEASYLLINIWYSLFNAVCCGNGLIAVNFL